MLFARKRLIWMLAGLGSSISLPAAFQPAETSAPESWFGSSCGITRSDTNSLLLNPWPIKYTFTMDKYVQHKQVRGITRISLSLLCWCQRFRQSLIYREGSTSQMPSTYKPHPLDGPMPLLWSVKDICKKGFDICSFLLLAKRKILETVHTYEQHHQVSLCWIQLRAGNDKPIPACESLSSEALNMLNYSCWLSRTPEASSYDI